MAHIEHAQSGLAGLLLSGTCAGRLAVVFPGFSVPLPPTSQAVIAITCFLTRCHIRVETIKEKSIKHLKVKNRVIKKTCKRLKVSEKSDTHLS